MQEQERQETEQALVEVIRRMRNEPEKYQDVRRAILAAESDEERVRHLLNFATSERELAALIPTRGEPGAELSPTVTTVTVTTVFI